MRLAPPQASIEPFGLNLTEVTPTRVPVLSVADLARAATLVRVATCHSWTIPSLLVWPAALSPLAVARIDPSELNATADTRQSLLVVRVAIASRGRFGVAGGVAGAEEEREAGASTAAGSRKP
jgi:hypothetical protein